MTITSFEFLLLIVSGAIVYYAFPKALQWVELLIISLIFYCFAAVPYTIIYMIISTLIAYGVTVWMDRERKSENQKKKWIFPLVMISLIINICLWVVFKGKNLWIYLLLVFGKYNPQIEAISNMHLVAALGMGYYTLQIMGYIIDCYWGNVKPQKNLLKLFLFVIYFPQLMTGPISRYADLTALYEKHKFSYINLSFGAQRILWGFVKKLVLAEKVGIIVSGITGNPDTYTGFYSWIVIFLYPIQMYADFSGCMDIILGVSELYDIHLAENFNNPFFSRTSQEFWQRWHITLGTWAKDYVLYPLLKSKVMIKLGKIVKKKFGKKTGKFIVSSMGMLVLWMVMGIWHGGLRYIVGVSLWYWIILMMGELTASGLKKMTENLKMMTSSFGWYFFQSIRTFLIYAVGATFFNVGVLKGIALLQDAWRVISIKDYANPWIFFDGSILDLGVTYRDINIIIVVIVILLVVGILREKYGYARLWIMEQSFLFRWSIWIGLFLLLLIYGEYGPDYSAAEFIYQGF